MFPSMKTSSDTPKLIYVASCCIEPRAGPARAPQPHTGCEGGSWVSSEVAAGIHARTLLSRKVQGGASSILMAAMRHTAQEAHAAATGCVRKEEDRRGGRFDWKLERHLCSSE